MQCTVGLRMNCFLSQALTKICPEQTKMPRTVVWKKSNVLPSICPKLIFPLKTQTQLLVCIKGLEKNLMSICHPATKKYESRLELKKI